MSKGKQLRKQLLDMIDKKCKEYGKCGKCRKAIK